MGRVGMTQRFQRFSLCMDVAVGSGGMAEGLGARLRQRREEQKIDLSVIAEQTKIKRSLLEALERDDLSQWPTGIFRRAWMRSYAKAIGADADATVRELLEAHRDPEEIPPVTPLPAPDPGLRGMLGAAFTTLSKKMLGTGGDEPIAPVMAPSSPAVDVPPAIDVPPIVESRPVEPRAIKSRPTVDSRPPVHVERPEFDLQSLAKVCTKLGQAGTTKDVQPLLQEVAAILDAAGLIVWVWHSTASVLRPTLVHGYSAGVVARLPTVTRDADNPTAASFRSGQAREVPATDGTCGALVLPLLLRSRCVGVLAIELQPGRELTDSARAVATIVAAAVAQLVSRTLPAEMRPSSSKRRTALSPVRGTV